MCVSCVSRGFVPVSSGKGVEQVFICVIVRTAFVVGRGGYASLRALRQPFIAKLSLPLQAFFHRKLAFAVVYVWPIDNSYRWGYGV